MRNSLYSLGNQAYVSHNIDYGNSLKAMFTGQNGRGRGTPPPRWSSWYDAPTHNYSYYGVRQLGGLNDN